MSDQIRYRDVRHRGIKYVLEDTYRVQTALRPENANGVVTTDGLIELPATGLLTIHDGYASDGPSGPTFDTKSFMRAAFVHAAAYQLIRRGLLPAEMRVVADKELHRMVLEDGMWRIRAWWIYRGLRFGGASAAERKPRAPTITAP